MWRNVYKKIRTLTSLREKGQVHFTVIFYFHTVKNFNAVLISSTARAVSIIINFATADKPSLHDFASWKIYLFALRLKIKTRNMLMCLSVGKTTSWSKQTYCSNRHDYMKWSDDVKSDTRIRSDPLITCLVFTVSDGNMYVITL